MNDNADNQNQDVSTEPTSVKSGMETSIEEAGRAPTPKPGDNALDQIQDDQTSQIDNQARMLMTPPSGASNNEYVRSATTPANASTNGTTIPTTNGTTSPFLPTSTSA